jgi:hypothetical protein
LLRFAEGSVFANHFAIANQPYTWAAGAQGSGAMGASATQPPQFNTFVRLDTRYYFSLGNAEPFTIAFFMKPIWPLNLLYDENLIPNSSGIGLSPSLRKPDPNRLHLRFEEMGHPCRGASAWGLGSGGVRFARPPANRGDAFGISS